MDKDKGKKPQPIPESKVPIRAQDSYSYARRIGAINRRLK